MERFPGEEDGALEINDIWYMVYDIFYVQYDYDYWEELDL